MSDDDQTVPAEDRPVAARIRSRRLEVGLVQQDLANVAKIDKTMVTKIEGHKRAVQLDFLRAIAPVLGVTVSWLLEGTEGSGVDVDHELDVDGVVSGPQATQHLGGRGYAGGAPARRVAVLDAAPGWCTDGPSTPRSLSSAERSK